LIASRIVFLPRGGWWNGRPFNLPYCLLPSIRWRNLMDSLELIDGLAVVDILEFRHFFPCARDDGIKRNCSQTRWLLRKRSDPTQSTTNYNRETETTVYFFHNLIEWF
jgi:hypothetical protein